MPWIRKPGEYGSEVRTELQCYHLLTPDCREKRLRAIPGFATGGRDFSCGRALGSAGIRAAWWAQPDPKRSLGAWGGP